MKDSKRIMGTMGILTVLLALSLTGFFSLCTAAGATDYSGRYYATVGPDPTFVLVINQAGSNATFTLEEATEVCFQGTVTVSGNTARLTSEMTGETPLVVTIHITFSADGQSFSGSYGLTGDNPVQGTITGATSERDIYDVDLYGIPQFVAADYIELAHISRISKFRSAEGHDYSDDFESCRSMKHYFEPKSDVDWSLVKIYSPVNGTVIGINEGLAGAALGIRIRTEDDEAENYGAFHFILYHVNLYNVLSVGEIVIAGQELGTHIGSQMVSDIAVGVNTPAGYRLVSYFDVMPDFLFQNYQARGLTSRGDAIISREERDFDPLTCNGEEFTSTGVLEGWVTLN